MAKQPFLMPKLGESITEAIILSWAKSVGDTIELDETLLEIATDKVDSELPSPFAGKVLEILYEEGEVVPVGEAIVIIETDKEEVVGASIDQTRASIDPSSQKVIPASGSRSTHDIEKKIDSTRPSMMHVGPKGQGKSSGVSGQLEKEARPSHSKRFYSPLVRSIAAMEHLSVSELDNIRGTGADGRVTKADVTSYVRLRSTPRDRSQINYQSSLDEKQLVAASYLGDVEIVEMDRTRRLIAEHMVRSKHTAPHVTSFLEIDMTNVVDWRNSIKTEFQEKHGQKITFTPIFIEAVSKAIRDFPNINASVRGHQIVLKKDINIGMATATDAGNLIVPVIKDVSHLDLLGITIKVNDLATRARAGKLKPDEVQGGTFTLTNVGTFGNTMGTPIINQPQVAIMSTGAIKKKPAVIESKDGDRIEIRMFMFLSLSYDHRIVDGALGGQFLRRVGDYLEGFDIGRKV